MTDEEKKKSKYGDRAEEFKIADTDIGKAGGFVRDRGCTDFLCLIVFVAFVIAMFACVIYSMTKGQPAKFLAPLDINSNFCGQDSFKDYPNLYLPKFSGSAKEIFNNGYCVKKCPSKSDLTITCAQTENYVA